MKPTFSIKVNESSPLSRVHVRAEMSIKASIFHKLTEKFDYGMHCLGAHEMLIALLTVFIEDKEFMDYEPSVIFTDEKLVLKTLSFKVARKSYDRFEKLMEKLSEEKKSRQKAQEIILECIESKIKTKLL